MNTVVQEEHDCKQSIIFSCLGEQKPFILFLLKHRAPIFVIFSKEGCFKIRNARQPGTKIGKIHSLSVVTNYEWLHIILTLSFNQVNSKLHVMYCLGSWLSNMSHSLNNPLFHYEALILFSYVGPFLAYRSLFHTFGFFVLYSVISAIAVINETIDKGDPQNTLQALQADAAKLSSIVPENSQLYQKLLLSQKTVKAQVRMVEVHYRIRSVSTIPEAGSIQVLEVKNARL